jgi:hypothetical protein
MVDKLHLGRLYHVGGRTFAPSDVDTGLDTITVTDNTIPDGTLIQFSTSGTLPAGLTAGVIITKARPTAIRFRSSPIQTCLHSSI